PGGGPNGHRDAHHDGDAELRHGGRRSPLRLGPPRADGHGPAVPGAAERAPRAHGDAERHPQLVHGAAGVLDPRVHHRPRLGRVRGEGRPRLRLRQRRRHEQRDVVRRLRDRRRALRALPAGRSRLRLQHRRPEGRPAEDERGLRAGHHERPASRAHDLVPGRRESLDHERRLHPGRHGDGAERGGDTVSAHASDRKFGDERGQSLVLTLLVLFVLAIMLSTVIIFTSSNQRTSNYQKAAQVASSLAEAGLNNAISVLANPANSANLENTWATSTNVVLPDGSTAHPAATQTYSGGTAAWWGTLNSDKQWVITGQGTVKNPTGPSAADIVKKVTA